MPAEQQFQGPEEAEETLKRAVELYHRDRTHQEAVDAALGALHEMDIPPAYFEAAKKEREHELERKQDEKRLKQTKVQETLASVQGSAPKTISEAIARSIHEWGFVWAFGAFMFACAIVGYLNHTGQSSGEEGQTSGAEVQDGSPQTWDLGAARNDFLLDTNPQTNAEMVKVRDATGAFERIQISSFGQDPKVSNDATTNSYYVKAYLNDQTVFFRGLHHFKFKARSKGLSKLYVGFWENTDVWASRFSKDLDLTPSWKEYNVNLDELGWYDSENNWKEHGRPPDKGGFYFFMGDNTNDLKESGNLDFKDVELTE